MTNDYLNFVARMGNATSVQTFENGVNCVVTVDFDYDSIYNNIQVLGYGSGDNQIKYTDQDATSVSTYGQKDLTINEAAIRDAATAQRYAEELISKLKDKKTLIKIEWVLGVEQLVARRGDKITVVDTISGNNINGVYRVYRITYKDDGTTILECVDEDTSKPLKFNEIMNSIRTNIVGESNYAGGSENYSTWGSGINAKTDQPLKVGFYVSSLFEENSVLRVSSLKVDYDIDKYNSQFGDASFTGEDPQVQNSSGGQAADVAYDSGNQNNSTITGSTTATNTAKVSIAQESKTITEAWIDNQTRNVAKAVDSQSYYGLLNRVKCDLALANSGGGQTFDWTLKVGGSEVSFGRSQTYEDSATTSSWSRELPVTGTMSGLNVLFEVTNRSGGNWAVNGGESATIRIIPILERSHDHESGGLAKAEHAHSDGTYTAVDHDHPDGTYDVNAADINYISIGDDIGEAGSVNASSVNLYLDFWNGSSWVNKHSILNTGETLESDVDITNSGTYPDATGYWRVRLEPITETPDYAQAIIKMQYTLKEIS